MTGQGVNGRRILWSIIVLLLVGSGVVATNALRTHSTTPRGASSERSTIIPLPADLPGPPVPGSGAYLGAWVQPEPFSQTGRTQSVERFESAIGTQLRIVHLYRKWNQPVGTPSDLAFARRGSYLLISWATPDLSTVVSGSQDALIDQRAGQIAALPTKVFLEVRWEMDRPNLAGLVHNPKTYKAAWSRIRSIFAARHVGNVAWTWCPTAAGFDRGTAGAYYPGDSSVDWICADVYPKTPWNANDYESFPVLADAFVAWASRHPRPIIIGEFAAPASYGDGRPDWIAAAAKYIKAHPQIKAAAWFDQTRPADPVYYHFALQGDGPSLQAFAAIACSSYFRPAS
jgi:hypothetical protein